MDFTCGTPEDIVVVVVVWRGARGRVRADLQRLNSYRFTL